LDDQKKDARINEYLANERTFLAWIRTSIAVLSLGFVVARFSVWLQQLAATTNPNVRIPRTGVSLVIGVAMMAFGGLLSLLAIWHYNRINRSISEGDARPRPQMAVLVTVLVLVLAIVMIVYMVTTQRLVA
jgi:putative membrane protein